jgi:hypothetical protein
MVTETAVVSSSCRAARRIAPRLVTAMLALPPLMLLLGIVLSRGNMARSRSDGIVWQFSPARMKERTRLIQNEIAWEKTRTARLVVERAVGSLRDGKPRGFWKSYLVDAHERNLLYVVCDDATGEPVHISQPLPRRGGVMNRETSLRTSDDATAAAAVWLGRIWPLSDTRWQPVREATRLHTQWRIEMHSSERHVLILLDAATGIPTFLSFRPQPLG